MNNFLRARFRFLSVDSIRNKAKRVGLLCGLVALVSVLATESSYGGACLSNAIPIPSIGAPQTVCSGNSGTLTLNFSTGTNANPDWGSVYVLDSSHDGGSTWHPVDTSTFGFPMTTFVYNTPPLINTSGGSTCDEIRYRFRLFGIVNLCSGGTTLTTAAAVFRVCPKPNPITGGPVNICVGQFVTLSVTPATGTWSSSLPGAGTISSTGVFTGSAAGTTIISYTNSSGCASTLVATVNALPAPIAGPSSLCIGSSATYSLTAAPFTGTWSTTNPAIGTINPTTGVYGPAGTGSGTTTIVFTNTATCTSSMNVSVNPVPTVFAVDPTGTLHYCAGGSGISLTLSGSETAAIYSIYNGASVVSTVAGTGAALPLGTFTAAGTYSVVAAIGTCTAAMTGTTTIVIDPAPSPISGASTICTGGSTTYTDLTAGTWSTTNTTVGSIDATSGVFTATSTPGVDTIIFTATVGGCTTSTTVTVVATPAITGSLAVCLGSTTTLSATPPGGLWSSSAPGVVANVGSTSGVVTGVGLGTANITYNAAGCIAFVTVTVNSVPAAITGPSTVCNGSCITLSNATAGGTWSLTPPSVATISSTGNLCGTGTGTINVTYTLGGGCFTTTTVNALAAPTPITGSTHVVCDGQTLTLSNGTSGGTWSSSNASNASVVSTTGVVTGVTAGTTATITYTTPGGCFATYVVSVEPMPAPITGTFALCAGQCTTLATTSTGGTWSSSNPAIGTIDATTGNFCADTIAGTSIIAYTFSTGCAALAVMTVNPLPGYITGPDGVCFGSSTTFGSSPAGGTWSSSIPPVGTINPTTGFFTGLTPGGVTIINYTLATGCTRAKSVTVNPLPLPIDGTPVVCVGSTITLSNASPGGPGTWSTSNAAIAGINSITGVVTGNNAGVATITFTLPTGCFTTVVVTVNPLPGPIGGFPSTCIGFCKTLTNPTPGGTWSSSDITIATMGSTTGLFCGLSAGTVLISYTLPTGCASVTTGTVIAPPGPPTGTLGICVGGTTTLSPPVGPGGPIYGGTWTSSDTIVAKVFLGTGLVTGITAGTADITYTTAEGCTSYATVTVSPVPPAITGTLYMCEGNTTTLSNLFPGGAWVSANTVIATVDPAGVVTGNAAGVTAIDYVLPSGCFRSVMVTVYPLPAIIGSVLVCPGVAAPLTGSPAGGLWASADATIATIGSLSGVVTGVATGTTFITYTLATTCRSTAVVTVQPLPAPITGPTQVCMGSSITLLNFTVGGGTWSSSTPSVGTINSTTGVFTGMNPGTTTITFTASSTGCITTAVVTVNPLPGAITATSGGVICAGNTLVLSSSPAGGTWSGGGTVATVNPTTGVVTGIMGGTENFTYTLPTGCIATTTVTVNDLPAPITGVGTICHTYSTTLSSATPGGIWSIAPTTVATISPTGVVTAVGAAGGTATVTYTDPTTTCFTTTIITVNPLPDTIVGIYNICLNDTTTYTSATPGGLWSSGNILIAVIGSTSGTLASVTAGTVEITYTLPTGCYTTKVITINPTPQPIVGPLSVCQTYTVGLSNVTTGGSWSSSNPSVGSIGSATGVVTGVSPGTVYITYTLPSSCPRVVQFTVNPNPAPISGPLTMCKGDTVVLTSSPGGTWSSANPSVAFIFMPTGQTIAINVGTATISYILPTGCFAIADVTVNPVPTATTIVGSRQVCLGNSATLINPPFPGGIWSTPTTTVVTVNPFTGDYTGVGVGTALITYTLPTGCDTFVQVTVNPLPATITGPGAVCIGDTITLTSATPGGTWSSSLPLVASIDATTGQLVGVSAGTTVVTYKLTATGCETIRIITVNPLPSPIVGPDHVCIGSSILVSSAPPGGSWFLSPALSSPGSAIITVVSATLDTAQVTGVSVGLVNVTYQLATGCHVITEIRVDPNPNPIMGKDTVCAGDTIHLSSAPLTPPVAGTWSSSNTTVGDIDTATGVFTGFTAGTTTITYLFGTGCFVTRQVTVHPLPGTITVLPDVCETYTTIATNTTPGGKWSVSDTLIATIDENTGLVTGVSPGAVTLTYKLITTCYVTAAINIRPLPVVTVNTPSIICKHASTTLTATGATTYSWSPSTGITFTTPDGANVVANPTLTATYTVIGTSAYGCMDTTTVTVTVDSFLNNIAVTGKDSICRGDCAVLIATGRQGTFFSWKPAAGLSCTICDTTTACPVSPTTYTLVAVDSLGCRDSLTHKLQVMDLPTISVSPTPAIVCNGSTTQLHAVDLATTSAYPTKFIWFPNAFISCDTCADPIFSNTTNIVYRVTGITPFGCMDSLRIPVTVLDSSFNSINRDTVICRGDQAHLQVISFNPDGSRSDYLWLNSVPDELKYSPNIYVRPDNTTTYAVAVTPNVCWPDTLYTTVVVVDKPKIVITPGDQTVATGTRVTLNASIEGETIISSYAWSSTGYLSCDSCFTTIAVPTVQTTYTFTATSQYGCTSSASVTLNVGCQNDQVYIPNVFSPNGDGKNDRFFVQGKGISNISKFLIYNRWGELVYERYNIQINDAGAGWDGQYKGVVLPPDVFVYVVEATCIEGGDFKYKGDISIVR